MAKIYCLPDKKSVDVSPSQTILDALLDAEIEHTHVCGGNAYCSTCRVMVLDGIENCTPTTTAERALAKKLDFPLHIRLACQTKIVGGADNVSIRRMVLDDEDLDLIDNQLSFGSLGNQRSLAILMVNIRGGRNFDEVNFPYDIIYVIGKYFHRMNKIVKQYGGTINNYMGIKFIALFGVDNSEQAAERATWAGLEMLESVRELNTFLKQLFYEPLSVSIGIHYSPAVLISVDPSRPEVSSVVGSALNQAGRVEALNKELNSELLVSEDVYKFIKHKAIVNRSHSLKISDKSPELKVYEITQMQGEAPSKIDVSHNRTNLSQRISSFWQKFSNSWLK